MQNKGALWIFTILLALACLWQLSFSFFTSRLESEARREAEFKADSVLSIPGREDADRAAMVLSFENEYLRANAGRKVYPVLGYTYQDCKEKEINLGLDLKGGMAVTLEVSIPELVVNLADNNSDPAFLAAVEKARERLSPRDNDFIALFAEEFAKVDPNGSLAAIFHSPERKDMFPRESSNEDIVKALRREAEAALNNTEKILRTRIDKFGVAQPSIQKQQFSGRIQIELPGVKDKERVRKVLQSTANLEFWETFENTDVYPLLEEANTRLRSSTSAAPVDTTTATETATASATDVVLDANLPDTLQADAADDEVALATDDDTTGLEDDVIDPLEENFDREEFERENPLFAFLSPSVTQNAQGGYNLARGPAVGNSSVKDTARVNELIHGDLVRSVLPADLKLLWSAKPIPGTDLHTLYALRVPRGGKAKLDGASITDAAQDFDMKGDVEVRMQMNAEGGQIWKVMTGDNVGKSIAIVLDDLVYSAPVVQSEIAGGRSSISMGTGTINEKIQEADDLANILKAGALPAPARIIEETIVGPSLGEENIRLGMRSFAIALLLVLIYMVLYYAGAGWVADLALVVNLFVLIGSLASLQAALTLPGIAGIVLTMGMAVDANVLIFERIREELRAGRVLKSAVDLGYKGALSAIIDSNVTTLITAVILLVFGSGPVQGFATTLGLGILTSLFTALFLSRLIISQRLEKGRNMAFWSGWSRNILVDTTYKFMDKRRWYYIISGVVIGVGIFSMVTNGFNWGVDFSGGRTFVVKFEGPVNVEQVRSALDPVFVDDAGVKSSVNVKTYGDPSQVKVTTNYMVDVLGTEVDAMVEGKLGEGLDQVGLGYDVTESRKVDGSVSDDIKYSALLAIGLALIFIFIYIAVRFRNWQFGVGGVVALLHDALIVLGLYSLLYKVMPFSMEIDEAFIAAILTVVGYSINDTVVVFDRMREYLVDHKRDPYITVFDKAINATLSRTLNTSLTTLLVLLIVFIFGGVSIKGFIFALLAGILVGTYSSVFVASSVVVDLLVKSKKDRPV